MKERLILLYKLNKIDKELQELNSLKGDIPSMIEDLTNQRTALEDEINNFTVTAYRSYRVGRIY